MKYETELAELIAAARAGRRCPINKNNPGTGPFISGQAVSYLAHAGEIEVRIYHPNWRVVEILKGDYAGATTAYPPLHTNADKPYMVINGHSAPRQQERKEGGLREPWKPGTPLPKLGAA